MHRYILNIHFAYFLFVFLLLGNGCSERNNSAGVLSNQSASLDTIQIISPPPLPNNYQNLRPVYKGQSLVAISGYNEAFHSIDIRPLGSDQDFVAVNLPLEGPNQVEEVTYFQALSGDSLIVTDDNHLYIFDYSGNLKAKIGLTIGREMLVSGGGAANREYTYGPYLNVQNGMTAFYDERKEVFYYPIRNRNLYEFFSLDFYRANDPLLAKVNLRTKEYSLLPITYPNEVQQTLYGTLAAPSFFIYEDGVYYGFGYSPDVYHYRFSDGFRDSYTANIKHPEPVPYQEGGMPDENVQVAYKFANIFYDPISEVVMRTYTYPKEMGKRGRLAAYYSFNKGGGFVDGKRIDCACPFFSLVPCGKGFYTSYLLGDEENYTLIYFPYDSN